ncbi:protein of unknown function [Arboricoccus pini]|uniref:Succinylarginine dihydrolase n=1 Tax=Arboricoccus pini TaxID=1963835 RepID=A0A212RIW7_9PROT|nr:DUF1839 family protein [Arboricoccus pini]SNB72270.1 protein of unknown function [Arboricoccus pini]
MHTPSFLPKPGFMPHALHGSERIWLETNCYTDLWIEVVHAMDAQPVAMLPFAIDQEFEGDQFTFFKPPLEDLRTLFGVKVQELAIFDDIVGHVIEQVERDRLVIVELDAFYLPDTQGASYHQEHVKTTVGIAEIDPGERRLGYFHNAGYFHLEGEDFTRIFRLAPDQRDQPELLFPYVEMVKREVHPLRGAALRVASLSLLRRYLHNRSRANPFVAFRERFLANEPELLERPMPRFHAYAFNNLRQAGANAELLGSYLEWLAGQGESRLEQPRADALRIAEIMKVMQFQLARAVHRRRPMDARPLLAELETTHDRLIGGLMDCYG